MRSVTYLAVGILSIVFTPILQAARPLAPPIDEVLSRPTITRIAVVVAEEKLPSLKTRFKVTEQISGESPEELVLRTDEETYADVVVAQQYIVAWTDLRKERRFKGSYEPDPEGASIVTIRGLFTPALYENSAEMRFLLAPRESPGAVETGPQIDALLAQAQRVDERSRDLVTGQLLIDSGLCGQMNADQAGVLKNIIQQGSALPKHQDYLLQCALRLPAEMRSQWLAEAFRRVIIMQGTQYNLSSLVPALVKTSATGLGETGSTADMELLGFLLYSNSPGVAKAAMGAMEHLDAAAAETQIRQASSRGWIAQQTRQAIRQYLHQKAKAQ